MLEVSDITDSSLVPRLPPCAVKKNTEGEYFVFIFTARTGRAACKRGYTGSETRPSRLSPAASHVHLLTRRHPLPSSFLPGDVDSQGMDPDMQDEFEAFIDEIEDHLLMQDFDPDVPYDVPGNP